MTTVLGVACIILFVTVIFLATKVHTLRKRPRIKKRIVVNKPLAPITCRPQSPEQCEITIENCCNMNICETVSNVSCVKNPRRRNLTQNDGGGECHLGPRYSNYSKMFSLFGSYSSLISTSSDYSRVLSQIFERQRQHLVKAKAMIRKC